MTVKNKTNKPIGFGNLVLLPDNIGTLPEGFGADHPTVKFYISKKWLEVVKGKAAKSAAPAKDDDPPVDPFKVEDDDDTSDGDDDLTDEEKAEAQRKADLGAKIEAVAKMNREPLREEATALGIEWEDADTVAVLRQKITARLQAEMG